MGARVTLHLAGHCIETAAKNEFRRLVDALLEKDDAELEARTELVRAFLSNADFPELRASDPRLAGEGGATVTLSRRDDGSFSIEFE